MTITTKMVFASYSFGILSNRYHHWTSRSLSRFLSLFARIVPDAFVRTISTWITSFRPPTAPFSLVAISQSLSRPLISPRQMVGRMECFTTYYCWDTRFVCSTELLNCGLLDSRVSHLNRSIPRTVFDFGSRITPFLMPFIADCDCEIVYPLINGAAPNTMIMSCSCVTSRSTIINIIIIIKYTNTYCSYH